MGGMGEQGRGVDDNRVVAMEEVEILMVRMEAMSMLQGVWPQACWAY